MPIYPTLWTNSERTSQKGKFLGRIPIQPITNSGELKLHVCKPLFLTADAIQGEFPCLSATITLALQATCCPRALNKGPAVLQPRTQSLESGPTVTRVASVFLMLTPALQDWNLDLHANTHGHEPRWRAGISWELSGKPSALPSELWLQEPARPSHIHLQERQRYPELFRPAEQWAERSHSRKWGCRDTQRQHCLSDTLYLSEAPVTVGDRAP